VKAAAFQVFDFRERILLCDPGLRLLRGIDSSTEKFREFAGLAALVEIKNSENRLRTIIDTIPPLALFRLRSGRAHHARGITELCFVVRRFRGALHID
jgi:hypothetical protein